MSKNVGMAIVKKEKNKMITDNQASSYTIHKSSGLIVIYHILILSPAI